MRSPNRHQQKKRKDRDNFLAEACESEGLSLKYVTVSNVYDHFELANFIDASCKRSLTEVA